MFIKNDVCGEFLMNTAQFSYPQNLLRFRVAYAMEISLK